ncbi:L2 [Trichechus manatus latirostris papillomavirus 3]|uniref:Minor capsid protein L2 n=1 Tax=Trichechus manatus latirostris papillomavirus 3 TaxID=2848316 RepID=A0A0F6TNT7_9PAPI|nr:L2 [Trichechus manatus latirostris papillomavirus 3]AKE50900.1 L2 [Trichechus manatus latirostris papillomavirus 3]
MPRLRTKRATVESIYRSCKATNTCSADVINTVEQNTLADRLLKWISGLVYFGNLGIGTAGGGGGRFGYGALGGTRAAITPSAARPPVVPETLGLLEVAGPTAGEIDAATPSIVPLLDGSTVESVNIEAVAEVHPAPPAQGTSTLGGVAETTGSILPASDPPIQTAVTHTEFSNPAYEITTSTSDSVGEISTGDHMVVVGGGSGQSIGEEIPLLQLSPDNTFDTSDVLETEFGGRTSTPDTQAPRVRGDRGLLYSRYTTQQEITNPTFLSTPYDLVAYNNPAFEGTDSFDFPPAASPYTVEAAPDPAFNDILHLGHARYSTTATNRVRVSRLGTRPGVRTRTGTLLTGRTHFYQDLSSINESLELTPLSERIPSSHSTSTSIGQSIQGYPDNDPIIIDSSFEIIDLNSTSAEYSEADLLDIYEDIADHAQLVIGRPRHPTTVNIPIENTIGKDTIIDSSSGFFVEVPEVHGTTLNPTQTDRDGHIFVYSPHLTSFDFLPHPSLLKRKRKRSLDDDFTILQ